MVHFCPLDPCWFLLELTLARTCFFTERNAPGGGRCHPPRYLASECARASRQRPADSLGRSKSNGVRVDLFRSTFDLPGQVKQKMFRFPGRQFRQVFRQ